MLAHSDMDGTLTPDTDRSVPTVLEVVVKVVKEEVVVVKVEVDISILIFQT